MRRLFAVISMSIVGLLVSAVPASAQAPPGPAGYYGQRLAWSGCGGGFQCAKVKVPLDYAKPKGRQIDIAVIRLRAKGPKRIGSLVLNPGGPGGSGVDLARNAKQFVSPALLARFDVVGFDPRGVGLSSPVRCLSYGVMDSYHALDPTPDTPSEVRKGDAYQQIYAQGCKANAGALLAHVGTRDAARDIDVLRAALGDRRLTYLGFSYGTLLGATYAEAFPKRVRAMVLDGAIDPATRGTAPGAAAHGFETARSTQPPAGPLPARPRTASRRRSRPSCATATSGRAARSGRTRSARRSSSWRSCSSGPTRRRCATTSTAGRSTRRSCGAA